MLFYGYKGSKGGTQQYYGGRAKGDLVLTGCQDPVSVERPSINLPQFRQWEHRPHERMDRSPSTRQQFYRHSRAENLGDYNQTIEGEAGERKP